MDLSRRLVDGDARALARAISLAEEDTEEGVAVLRAVFRRGGKASVIGVTGAPGAGKSSLVDRLVGSYRRDGRRVGVVAVDPSSAYSGGAILGDRIRMQEHSTDNGVFIRSMATRGYLGGLSRTANDAVDLMDAAGYDPVIVETVGVGQDEVDVARAADVVVVVLVPGMGDDIQAIKAGILEIADVFVINKADRPGVDRLVSDLEYMLSLVDDPARAHPRIVRTVATRGEGIEELRDAVRAFGEVPEERRRRSGRRREREESRLRTLLAERMVSGLIDAVCPGEAFAKLIEEIADRRTDPYSAARALLEKVDYR